MTRARHLTDEEQSMVLSEYDATAKHDRDLWTSTELLYGLHVDNVMPSMAWGNGIDSLALSVGDWWVE